MTDDELIEAADRNMVAAFAALIPNVGHPKGGIRTFDGVTAVATGVPAAFYNPVVVLAQTSRPQEVRAAVEWVRTAGPPACVLIRAGLGLDVSEVCADLGLAADTWLSPAMGLDPIPAIPATPRGLEVRPVRTPADLEDWHVAASSGDNLRRALPEATLRSSTIALVTGYVEGAPVSSAAAIRSEEVFGIYAVGTLAAFRGRGLGTAMTWTAIEIGVGWGYRAAILQASELGFRVYERMGFRTLDRYVLYLPAAGEGGSGMPA